MSLDGVFSTAWATALEHELAADDAYRRSAASWNGSLLFVLEANGDHGIRESRRLFLDLAHGNVHAVRPALDVDEREAHFRLAAPAATWIALLDGELEPGTALMTGRLRLERGSLFSLFPHLESARLLLACAQRVGSGRRTAVEPA